MGEVKRALNAGLHCVVFSNNVPLSEEREMKELAREKGLLCMGPDCGVANINGAAPMVWDTPVPASWRMAATCWMPTPEAPQMPKGPYPTIKAAAEGCPRANLCSIAVPGEYALGEVKRALNAGKVPP